MSRRLLGCALLIACSAVALRAVSAIDLAPRATRLTALPQELAGWHGTDEPPLDAATAAVLNADSYLLRSYVRNGVPIGLFVAFYSTQRTGSTMHSPLNCLPGAGWTWAARQREQIVADDGTKLDLNRNIATKDRVRLLVDYWYQSRGRAVASEYSNKLLLMRDALARHRSDGALVRVTVDASAGVDAASREATDFIQALYPALTAHLPE
jgi:EpsI family protein